MLKRREISDTIALKNTLFNILCKKWRITTWLRKEEMERERDAKKQHSMSQGRIILTTITLPNSRVKRN